LYKTGASKVISFLEGFQPKTRLAFELSKKPLTSKIGIAKGAPVSTFSLNPAAEAKACATSSKKLLK